MFYLDKLLAKVGVEPSIEDRVADTRAHCECVTQAKREEV